MNGGYDGDRPSTHQSGQEQQHHSPAEAFEEHHIQSALERRRQNGSLRKLIPYYRDHDGTSIVDFSSNDYLGLAQSQRQQEMVERAYQTLPMPMLGSTGSRLLTGDSLYAQELEHRLARYHNRPAALLCNSGYDANLAVLSSLSLGSTVIMDKLCHNSIQMGVRLSRGCTVRTFRHNCLRDLERTLVEGNVRHLKKPALVVIESVYSMDGDFAPLREILDLALTHKACVIVDEAHGLGVFGKHGMGLLEEYGLENHTSLLCSIFTFGKAAGCHGAVVCGSHGVREYLYNFGRPIVYSTSLPLHSLVCVSCSYETMRGDHGKSLREQVMDLVDLFRSLAQEHVVNKCGGALTLAPSTSPIQALIIPNNNRCVDFCNTLWMTSGNAIRLYPIRSPTVPKGQERVRIVLHAHNTSEQVRNLIRVMKRALTDIVSFNTTTSGPTTMDSNHDENESGLCSRL
jgi:8-amino-7-oxononanoate synthase